MTESHPQGIRPYVAQMLASAEPLAERVRVDLPKIVGDERDGRPEFVVVARAFLDAIAELRAFALEVEANPDADELDLIREAQERYAAIEARKDALVAASAEVKRRMAQRLADESA